MKFNAYFIQMNHPETSFTGNIIISKKTEQVNFKKIEKNLFIVYLKTQIEFKFLDTLKFKNKNIIVLFPVLSKYNKRRLKKMATILPVLKKINKTEMLLDIMAIEKSLKVEKLLHFFSLEREKITSILIELELQKKIKIIDFNTLFITSYQNYLNCLTELGAICSKNFKNRIKKVSFSEIESKLKIPHSSIFFKYLLNSFYNLNNEFDFKIHKDKIIFKKLALTEKEKKTMNEIESILKKNRLSIFTIQNIQQLSGLEGKEINNSLWYLVDEEKVIQLNGKYFIFSADLTKIINKLKKFKRNQGDLIDIKSLRELTLFSREYIITLFEYFDSQNITQRLGNKRKIILGV